jgi:hypothetical protein
VFGLGSLAIAAASREQEQRKKEEASHRDGTLPRDAGAVTDTGTVLYAALAASLLIVISASSSRPIS